VDVRSKDQFLLGFTNFFFSMVKVPNIEAEVTVIHENGSGCTEINRRNVGQKEVDPLVYSSHLSVVRSLHSSTVISSWLVDKVMTTKGTLLTQLVVWLVSLNTIQLVELTR
jgi:hypothetical protein